MTNNSKFLTAATASLIVALSPVTAQAGTRAADSKPQAVTTQNLPAGASQGPKSGFPSSPGLEIAKIKANDNAAFKRKSNGT